MADFQDLVVCGLVPPEKIRQDRRWRYVYRHEQWTCAVCLVRRDEAGPVGGRCLPAFRPRIRKRRYSLQAGALISAHSKKVHFDTL